MGGYLTWQRFPGERVFVDGRLEAYPESFFRSYFRILDDPRVWQELTGEKKIKTDEELEAAARNKKKEPEKPRLVVDVFRGDKHVQETFR